MNRYHLGADIVLHEGAAVNHPLGYTAVTFIFDCCGEKLAGMHLAAVVDDRNNQVIFEWVEILKRFA
jgi:hypothetical protein